MIHDYKGHYPYSAEIIENWDSTSIGVYYCGYKTQENKLIPLYIGKGAGEGGMRSRLLDHLREDNWPDITHFGYRTCDTEAETEELEKTEIAKYKPRYNHQGK